MNNNTTSNALTSNGLQELMKQWTDMAIQRLDNSIMRDMLKPYEPTLFKPMEMKIDPAKPKLDYLFPPIHKDFAISTFLLLEDTYLHPRKPVMASPDTFMGYVLKESPLCRQMVRVQFRYPKSKGKRIRKKWAKRSENFRHEEQSHCYILHKERMIILYPGGIAQLRHEAERYVV